MIILINNGMNCNTRVHDHVHHRLKQNFKEGPKSEPCVVGVRSAEVLGLLATFYIGIQRQMASSSNPVTSVESQLSF